MISPTPVVHIGMPKTATKTLQWRLFSQHSDIYYLGRYDGPLFRGKYREFEACRDAEIFDIMDQVAYSNIHKANIAQCRLQLNTYLEKHNHAGLLPVWSWESYCTDSSENRLVRAKNLKGLLGQARIVVGIRHPVSLLESAFLQQVKRDNVGGYYRWGKGAFYCDINQWLSDNANDDIDNHLEYAKTIAVYVELFGRENVCVLPLEHMQADRQSYYRQLCTFMKIDVGEALSLTKSCTDNTRWTEIQLQRLAKIHRSSMLGLKFRYASKPTRKKLLDLDRTGQPLTIAPWARAKISRENRRQLIERTRTGNKWLQELFELNLDSLGYFSP